MSDFDPTETEHRKRQDRIITPDFRNALLLALENYRGLALDSFCRAQTSYEVHSRLGELDLIDALVLYLNLNE